MTMMVEKKRLKIFVTLLVGALALAVLSCILTWPGSADAQTRGSTNQVRPATGSSWDVNVTGTPTVLPAPASMAAFGSQLVSQEYVETSLAFPYNINTELVSFVSDGGIYRSVPPFVELSGDAGAIAMESKEILRYLPGQGVNVRFTTVWGPCTNGKQQEVGAGTDTNGFFFGCCPSCGLDGGASFATLRRSGGVDNWTPQASWNMNTRPDLNIAFGSPYAIDYQWLGFGQVRYHIENPTTGLFEPVHIIRYANTSASTSTVSPNFPLRAAVTRGAVVRVPSMSLLRQGQNNTAGVRQSASNRRNAASGAPVLLFAVRNNSVYAGATNQVRLVPDVISVNNGGNSGQDVTIRFVIDTVPTGPSFVDTDAATSISAVDKTATVTVGGRTVLQLQAEGSNSETFDLKPYLIRLRPGSVLGVTAQSVSGTPSIGAAISWVEEF